jgi:nucleoside-diphosphate-sugar epimerase
MFRTRLASLSEKPTYIRGISDLLIVHICMLISLPLATLYQTAAGSHTVVIHLLHDFWPYYFTFFAPFSVLFPLLFVLGGLYSQSALYSGRHRALVLGAVAGSTVVIFFVIDYLRPQHAFSSRMLVLIFCALIMLVIPATRIAKAVIVKQFPYTQAKASELEPKIEGRSVLIVGGAGYIGSMLTRRLLAAGYHVRLLDCLVYGDSAICELIGKPGFELQVGDCRNIQAVARAIKGVDSIVHLAAIVGDPACDLNHQATLEINYAATRMLCDVVKGHGIKRFIFASSCSVYGATEECVTEVSPAVPISLYGQTKVDSEEMLLAARSEEFAPTILRLATVFGHSYRPRFDLVVNLLTAKAYQERTITIFNGQQWRPFIHVRDIARAMAAILAAPLELVGGQIYNVGDSRLNHTLSDIALKVRASIPETEVVHVENSDKRNYRVCFDKIHEQLGFECEASIEDGIKEMKQAFEDGLITDYTNVGYHNQRFLLQSGTPQNEREVDGKVMAAFAAMEKSMAVHA